MKRSDPSRDDNGFSLWPTDITEDAWFYADKAGLAVVVRATATTTIEIPWRLLKDAIERHRSYERRKKTKRKPR